MPRRGIHPLMRSLTVVLRNGASVRVPSALNREAPLVLSADTSTHPAWTGERAGLSVEDARIARLLQRFQGFVPGLPEGTAAGEPGERAAAAAGGEGEGAAAAAAAAAAAKPS